jgi:hypothetical protein
LALIKLIYFSNVWFSESKMSSGRAPSRVERLVQLLKDLDAFSCDSTEADLLQLANEAKRAVTKMQNVLKRSQVEQVAKLVQAKEWDKATQQMKINFPGGNSIAIVEEVLELVYVGDNLDNLTTAIKWVDKLDASLRPRAYRTLYEQVKFKRHTDQPQVLMLWRRIKMMPASAVLDSVLAQLDADFQRILEQIVEGIKKKDYSLIRKIDEMCDFKEGELVMNEVVTAIVSKFETCTMENVVLLVQFSMMLRSFENSCYLIDALMKALEAGLLQDSEIAMQLWVHAKYTKEEQPNWDKVQKSTQKLCTNVLDKLTLYKLRYFRHYQRYVEDDDKQKIENLHHENWNLRSIVSDFVSWYYKKEDPTRVHNLLAIVNVIDDFEEIQRVLTQLHIEMVKFQQTNTFEAFCLYNMVKHNMLFNNYESLQPKLKASFEQLKAKAPSCLRLLLWPKEDEKQLRLVNKFYDSPLCIQDEKVFCCSSQEDNDQEQLCSVSVEADTALTTYSFKCGDTRWKLDASDSDNVAKVTWTGTRWKLKPADEHHVQIFTDDGKDN